MIKKGNSLLCWLTLAVLALASTGVFGQSRGFITVASTTSTQNSGLFETLIPTFQAATDIAVQVVAVGTGQALRIGCNGDADAVLVHAPAAEQAFIDQGCGVDRREVMFNDFVLIGPRADPANVAAAGSAVDAFARIATEQPAFASRGDDSGTHKREMSIWKAAGVDPAGRWYRALGAGMGAALNTAAGMNAYVMSDRATWISFNNRQDLAIVYQGDPQLFNQYASVLVNPDRHAVKHDLAQVWHEWLVSDEGQAAIADYRRHGQALFTPNAK